MRKITFFFVASFNSQKDESNFFHKLKTGVIIGGRVINISKMKSRFYTSSFSITLVQLNLNLVFILAFYDS